MVDNMDVVTCAWSPKYIVELFKYISWPIVSVILAILFKTFFHKIGHNLFRGTRISELTLGTSGATAKFEKGQDVSGKNISTVSLASLPDGMSADAIRARQLEYQTEYSELMFDSVNKHVSMMNVSDNEKIELLARDVSLLQCAMKYIEVNRVIFRSQYNLLGVMVHSSGVLSSSDVDNYFSLIKAGKPEDFSTWDSIKYISYLVGVGLIVSEGEQYKITVFGRSYLVFMSKNPQMVDGLNKV